MNIGGNDITSRSSRFQKVERDPVKTESRPDLLKILEELEQSASNLKPDCTHQNREDRELPPPNEEVTTAYQLPGRVDEPGSTGEETGKENAPTEETARRLSG